MVAHGRICDWALSPDPLCCAVLCCAVPAGEQLSVLLGLPLLRSLSLVDGDISEDSLASVGRCTKLTRLELQVCPLLQYMILLCMLSSLLL